MTSEKWADRISKLLNRAKNPSVSAGERQNLIDKATYLMAKYGIEESMLRFSDKSEPQKVTTMQTNISGSYRRQRSILLNNLAHAFGCSGVLVNKENVITFGYQNDLDRVKMLYTSLLVQMFTELSSAQKDKPSYVHGKSYNTSWIVSYVTTVLTRVRTMVKQAESEVKAETEASGPGMEIALRSKTEAIDKEVKKAFPRLSTDSYSYSYSNYAGAQSGKSAGLRADIGQTRLENNKSRSIGS